ncbi:MAG: hypothetical protein ACLRRT_15875 [Ruthenibacterium lactatiformans]
MAASRRKKKQRKEKFEKALTAVLCGIVAVLVLLAAVISLSEETAARCPLAAAVQLVRRAAPVPHLPEEAAGAATKYILSTWAGRRCSAGTERRIRTHRRSKSEAADGLVAYLQAAGAQS